MRLSALISEQRGGSVVSATGECSHASLNLFMINPIVDDDPTTQDWHHLFSVCLSIVGLIWYVFIWSVGLLGCWTA